MARIPLKRRGPGDEGGKSNFERNKRQNVSGSASTSSRGSSRHNVPSPRHVSGRPNASQGSSRHDDHALPPPLPLARPTPAVAPTKQPTLPASSSRSQDKGKGVATPPPPSSELEPATLMSLPEHLRAVMNLMAQDFTATNWKDLREQDWAEALQDCFSSINSALFTLSRSLEPATTARNLEKSLRAELVALQADHKKVLWENKKLVHTLEKGKQKFAEVVTAREELEQKIVEVERQREEDRKDCIRQVSHAIIRYKETPDFQRYIARGVENFKEYFESGEFAAMMAMERTRAVEAWRESEEFAAEIVKAEAQGADDLQFTITSIRPDIDLGFLFETPPTPLLVDEGLEIPEIVISTAAPTEVSVQVEDSTIPVVELEEQGGVEAAGSSAM